MEEKVVKSSELEEFLRETSLKPSIINPILEANESSRPSVQSCTDSYKT